jgi:Noc2p family
MADSDSDYNLEELDPEFFEYMRENEKDLLTEIEKVVPEVAAQKKSGSTLVITTDVLSALMVRAEQQKSLQAFKTLAFVYKSGIREDSSDKPKSKKVAKKDAPKSKKTDQETQSTSKIQIDSPVIFDACMEFVLRAGPGLLLHHLGGRGLNESIDKCRKYPSIKYLARVILGETLYLLSTGAISEENSRFILKSLTCDVLVELLLLERKLKPMFLKQLSSKYIHFQSEIFAFLQLLLSKEPSLKEMTMKRLVLEILKSIEINPNRVSVIDLAAEHVILLTGDSQSTDILVKIGTVAIRQLASSLASGMDPKSNKNVTLFNLPICRAVRFWAKIFCHYKQLESLIFPLSQVISSIISFKSAHPIYFPMIANLADTANFIGTKHSLIPISKELLISIKIIHKRLSSTHSEGSTSKPVTVENVAKLQEAQLKDKKVLEHTMRLLLTRLAEHCQLLKTSNPDCYELIFFPVKSELKKIHTASPNINALLKALCKGNDETLIPIITTTATSLKKPGVSVLRTDDIKKLKTTLIESASTAKTRRGLKRERQAAKKKEAKEGKGSLKLLEISSDEE